MSLFKEARSFALMCLKASGILQIELQVPSPSVTCPPMQAIEDYEAENEALRQSKHAASNEAASKVS